MTTKTIDDLSSAELPLGNNDLFILSQGGVTRSITKSNLSGALSGTPSMRVLGPFQINYDDSEFASAPFTKELWTPEVGDVLLDVWFSTIDAWVVGEDVNVRADIGTFYGETTGVFEKVSANSTVNLLPADDFSSGLCYAPMTGRRCSAAEINGYYASGRTVPNAFSESYPLKVCVSTTGATDGEAVQATTGTSIVYLVVATPFLP